jgi:putative transposase
MALSSAFDLKDATYHVVHKAAHGQPCFFADDDYRLYLGNLKTVARFNGCEIHAYVLMSHYVQLLATGHELGAVAGMVAAIGRQHAQHLASAYGIEAPVWEQRYRASPVLQRESILKCYRFIELHPVRMGSAEAADQYPWSSYLVNALGFRSELVVEHPAYASLGEDVQAARSAYRKLCERSLDDADLEAIKDALLQGRAISTRLLELPSDMMV